MSRPELDAFLALVRDDEELQRKLRDLDDWWAFSGLVQSLAAERGLAVTVEDVRTARTDAREAWMARIV
jgi:hypothetical protein